MPKWLVTRHKHYCGRCQAAIEAGAVGCMVTLPQARVTVWRCTSCWPAPDGTIPATEPAVLAEPAGFRQRVAALIARFR